jgi:hypothetical protein
MNDMNTAELKVKEVIQDVHTRVFQGSIPERVMNKLVKNISKVYEKHAELSVKNKEEPTLPELTIELGEIINV